jgi:hypothetical protein
VENFLLGIFNLCGKEAGKNKKFSLESCRKKTNWKIIK